MTKSKINIHAKSGLARLMAIENLNVIHNPSVKTASFDTKDRILTLPVLKEMTGFTYDAFISHEVAHALWTPYNSAIEKKHSEVLHGYINVTEDARIEKLIKRKYPGTVRDFYKFYKKYSSPENDFFGLKAYPDLSVLGLIDRINLHFKIGSFVKVPFKPEEQKFVDMVAKEETFEDAVLAAKAIYEYAKSKGEESEIAVKMTVKGGKGTPDKNSGQGKGKKPDLEIEIDLGENDEDSQPETDQDENSDSDDNSDDTEQESNSDSDGNQSGEKDSQEGNPKDNGDKSEKSSKSSKENDNSKDTQSSSGKNKVDQPKSQEDKNLDPQDNTPKIVIKVGVTQDNFDSKKASLNDPTSGSGIIFGDVHELHNYKEYLSDYDETLKNIISYQTTKKDVKYEEFIRLINPTINMMVSHFNMRKSALEYQKIKIAKSGKLNLDELSMYQVNDDIFLRSEVTAESKNHGMVMLIDWSPSMSSFLGATSKQLIILMEFCRKVQIPFEVYGFASTQRSSNKGHPAGTLFSSGDGEIFLMFSSDMRKIQFKEASKNFMQICHDNDMDQIHYTSGTPLNISAFLMEYVIRDFKQKHNCEKTVFVLLSDGSPTDHVREGVKGGGYRTIMRDKNTGVNYEFTDNASSYHTIFKYIKDKYAVSKMMGFFLTDSLSQHTINMLSPGNNNNTGNHMSEFNSKKSTVYKNGIAFDKYYAVSINNFELDKVNYLDSVDANTSDNVKKKQFMKELTKNVNSMIFMKSFIEEIS